MPFLCRGRQIKLRSEITGNGRYRGSAVGDKIDGVCDRLPFSVQGKVGSYGSGKIIRLPLVIGIVVPALEYATSLFGLSRLADKSAVLLLLGKDRVCAPRHQTQRLIS
jgi:hypothetical protein